MLIGIDIGGTKICVCSGEKSGKIIRSKKILTQELRGAKKGLETIVSLVKEVSQEKPIHAIGISSPGPISTKEGKMLNPPNLPGWENTKIVSFFEQQFHKPTLMNNDANAGALAEYQFGASKGCPNLVYLTCSTGMGAGIILNGKILQGASDTAAEVGHFVLDINGPECFCGQSGCFEVFCGGRALAKKMQTDLQKERIHTQILEEVQGDLASIDAHHLIHAVKMKDPYALKVWEEYILRLAQGIGTILMNFNPESLILGTMAIHAGEILLAPLKKQLVHFAWRPNIDSCRIEASRIGEHQSELSGLALAIQAMEV